MADIQTKTVEAKKEKEKESDKAAADLTDVLARATKFYQKWSTLGRLVDSFTSDFRGLRSDIVQLLNAKDAVDRQVKLAEIRLSQAEREAQSRLSSVEQGHRTLIDRLSQKEIELQHKMEEMEKRELHTLEERNKYELLKDEYERKLAAMTRIEPAISKK